MLPFQPHVGATLRLANTTGGTAGVLPEDAQTVVLYNTSSSATAFWRLKHTNPDDDGDPTAVAPGVGAGNEGDFPVPPGQQIRITVAEGRKKFAVIATAADGDLYITPGKGD